MRNINHEGLKEYLYECLRRKGWKLPNDGLAFAVEDGKLFCQSTFDSGLHPLPISKKDEILARLLWEALEGE